MEPVPVLMEQLEAQTASETCILSNDGQYVGLDVYMDCLGGCMLCGGGHFLQVRLCLLLLLLLFLLLFVVTQKQVK